MSEPSKPSLSSSSLSDDAWIERYNSLLPAAYAHALGLVGFMWNGCEKRLLDLYWMARGLKDGEKHGADKAMRSSEIQKEVVKGLKASNAPTVVIEEVEHLLVLYDLHQVNRNHLSHYALEATNNPTQNTFRLVGLKRGKTFEINDDLKTIRAVADSFCDFMPYLNEVLFWSSDLLRTGATPRPSPDRPPAPLAVRPPHDPPNPK